MNKLTLKTVPFFLAIAIVCGFNVPSRCDILYNPEGRRDPFVPIHGQDQKQASRHGLAWVQSIRDIQVQGVLLGPGGDLMIVLNGEILSEGQTMGAVRVNSISGGFVTLSVAGEVHRLVIDN